MTFQFKITVNKTKIPAGISDFVYLFSNLTATVPAGFWTNVVDPAGLDIRFYDSNNITELKREIVSYSAGGATVEAWVKIPLIDNLTDKEIYCRYGGATRSSDLDLWSDVQAQGVWHLQTTNDSTPNANHGFGTNITSVAGKIGRGYYFVGPASPSKINCGNDPSLRLTSQGTLSCWVKTTQTAHIPLIGKENFNTSRNGYTLELADFTPCKVLLENSNAASALYMWKWPGYNLRNNSWHYIAATWNSGVGAKLYADGQMILSQPWAMVPVSSVYDLLLGAIFGRADFFLEGSLDDARVYNTSDANLDAIILAQYNNQNDPVTFSSCGPESPYGAGATSGLRPGKTRGPFTG